jgi:hypothetical protein
MSLPAAFLADVAQLIPKIRRFDDPLSTLAFGTDASFYRLIPQLVIRVESEDEVVALLKLAQRDHVPVTFRAAGTSLSGQAISDSVLIVLGDNWNGREIRGQGTQIRLQPGVIGAQANAWLAPFGRKIGPDRRRSTPAKSAASSPTMPAACAAVRRKTPTTPWPGFAWCWPTAAAWTPKMPPASRHFVSSTARCLNAWPHSGGRRGQTLNCRQNPPQIPSEKYHRPVTQRPGGFR